jgi:hypothetical protein
VTYSLLDTISLFRSSLRKYETWLMHYMDMQFKSSLGFLWDVVDRLISGALHVSSMPKQLAETRPNELDTLYVYVHLH